MLQGMKALSLVLYRSSCWLAAVEAWSRYHWVLDELAKSRDSEMISLDRCRNRLSWVGRHSSGRHTDHAHDVCRPQPFH